MVAKIIIIIIIINYYSNSSDSSNNNSTSNSKNCNENNHTFEYVTKVFNKTKCKM